MNLENRKDYSDPVHAIDGYKLERAATAIALYCLPGCNTQDWRKDRVYWDALQLAWLTGHEERGKEMLADLKALKRLGEHELEVAAAETIIRKYHALQFPEQK